MRAGIADTLLIVFARAPQAGRTKTRLIPRLGAWRSARLQERLIACALRTARDADCATVELHVAPAHGFFDFPSVRFRIEVKKQKGEDLGERMFNAMAAALKRHRAAIIVGTDCPALSPRDLQRAARLLRGACDVVLAPAEDGGYALIGMKKAASAVFEGISWGTPSVYAGTVERLARTGLRWRALRTVWDVDRPQDLERLAALAPGRVRSLRSSSGRPPGARR